MNFEPTDQDIVVNADELKGLASQLYQKAGVPKVDADAVAHLQVETDLHGIHSHGTRALAGYVRGILGGRINPTPNLAIVREGPAFGRVNGDRCLGHVAGKFSMELAIEKAKTAGIDCTRNDWAISGFWSISTFTSLTAPPASRVTFSSTGPSCRQGPHHGAQRSTMTGVVLEASTTSLMKLAVVASDTTSGIPAGALISVSM